MPLAINYAIGNLIGWISFYVKNRNRHIAEVNLNICFPDKDHTWRNDLLKKSLQENSKTLLESLWLWRHSSHALTQLRGRVFNENLLKDAKEKNKATIFVTPHFGSWEYAGLLTASNCNLMIMYAPPKLDYLHKLSYEGRSSTGAQLIETNSAGLKTLVNHLKGGGSVGILPDQVPVGNGGVYAPFFSRLAYTTTLVGKLANRFNCEIVFCYSLRNHENKLRFDTYYFSVGKELNKNDMTSAQALNTFIEECISKAPEQYLWSYKRFKKPPPNTADPY